MKTLVRLIALFAALWIIPAHASGSEAETARVALEDAVLQRINFARQHPQAYAQQLRTYRTWFRGNILYLPGERDGVYLEEGVAAVDEAIAFMERQKPLSPLSRGELLGLAARDHAGEQGPRGIIGHGSLDGASPGMRVQRRGGGVYVGENISYGFADPDEVVRQFIVDDGVPDRGHRHAVFSTDYRFAGVGCGPHSVYRHMCVVDMSQTRDGHFDMAGTLRRVNAEPGRVTQVAWNAPQRQGYRQAGYDIPSPASLVEAGGDEGDYEVVEIVEIIEE